MERKSESDDLSSSTEIEERLDINGDHRQEQRFSHVGSDYFRD
jgi:hypothetical protein